MLDKIERHGFDVINSPVRHGKFTKMRLAFRARAEEKRAPARPPRPKHVVVLGAGYAGLTAAADLVLRGHRVTLLEARALMGGRAQSFVEPKTGLTLDNGQHILMGCYHETIDLLRRLGVEGRLQRPAQLQVPFYSERGRTLLAARAPRPATFAFCPSWLW